MSDTIPTQPDDKVTPVVQKKVKQQQKPPKTLTAPTVVEEVKKPVENDVVTPWDVEAETDKGIDYDKLIKKFGSEPITEKLLVDIEKLTSINVLYNI
jgi:hypothetical protein